MKKIIHKLRQKPLEHRIQILNIASILSVIILIMLWFWSFSYNIYSNKDNFKNDIEKHMRKTVEPINSLKENFIEGYKNISSDLQY